MIVRLDPAYPGHEPVDIPRQDLATGTNGVDIIFPECTGGSTTITTVWVGNIPIPLNHPIAITMNCQPRILQKSLTFPELRDPRAERDQRLIRHAERKP